MKERDYYTILGLSKNATKDEIQRAYRKLARKYHPDVNKDKSVEDKFKLINEAYEVLKDPEKKKLYDTYGHNWEHAGSQPHQGWEGFSEQTGPEGFSRTFRFGKGDGFGHFSSTSDFAKNTFLASSVKSFFSSKWASRCWLEIF